MKPIFARFPNPGARAVRPWQEPSYLTSPRSRRAWRGVMAHKARVQPPAPTNVTREHTDHALSQSLQEARLAAQNRQFNIGQWFTKYPTAAYSKN